MKKQNPKKVLSKVLIMMLTAITFSFQDTTMEEVETAAATAKENKISKK
jgi:hypothetical protein